MFAWGHARRGFSSTDRSGLIRAWNFVVWIQQTLSPSNYLRCRGGIQRHVISTIRVNATYETVNAQAGKS